jgi:dipeptidyl aminopeptidase/acylaminoacyl peptidase
MGRRQLMAALSCVGVVAGAAAATAAAAPPGEPLLPFSVSDLVRLSRISEVAAAPDGKRVVFTLRTNDMEANKGRSSVWLLETDKRGAAPQQLTDGGDNSNSPEWSNDGRFVYFLSNRGGSTQVWRAAPGGAATQVTKLPLDVGSFHVAPQQDRIVVSAEVFLDCEDLDCTKQRIDAKARSAATGVMYQQLMVRHWDTWGDGRRSQLFAIALSADGAAAAAPVNISGRIGDVPGKPFGGREDFAISPDGTRVAFATRAMLDEAWSTNFDIYLVPADGSAAPRNLTADNPAADVQPSFSPGGSQLAYLAQEHPGAESDRFHLVLLDLRSQVKRPLTLGWDRSIASFAWARDGKTLFAATDHLGQHPLWAVDVGSGRASAITGAGDVETFSVATRRVYFAQSSLRSPADLFSVGFTGGRPVQLTHVNQTVLEKRKFGDYAQFNFPGWNGENVFGYLVKPVDFKRDRKYPVAFLVHGGPQGSFGNAWSYRWNPQIFAGAGYAAVMIDFHGSTGYGQAFTDSISGDWGGKPLQDLRAGLEAAIKDNAWMDGERVCALGASYGGFMINWIAGQWPDRFKCLVSHDGIFDNRSMYYSTEELWFPEHEFGGPEYDNPAQYAKFNPADFVTRWKTPTLVIHGMKDYRVPDSQGLAVFTALQRRGVPSELLYFPDENHWVLKPADSVEWYEAVLSWLNRWLR